VVCAARRKIADQLRRLRRTYSRTDESHERRRPFLPVGDAAHRQATPAELQLIDDDIEKGLGRGALAVGMGINYTAAATHDEIVDVFGLAGKIRRFGARALASCRDAGADDRSCRD